MENKKEYARNENGEIFVVLNKYERGRYGEICVQLGDFHTRNFVCEEWEHLLKIRKKPIDLIEPGDYVNGQPITKITYDPFIKGQTDLWTDRTIPFGQDFQKERFLNEDIKTILTHEQYEQNCYRLEENNG